MDRCVSSRCYNLIALANIAIAVVDTALELFVALLPPHD